jgi:hypothetical protein
MKRAASCAMVMLLMSTLLWGGCLSCTQYFMKPAARAGDCCKPSGECRKTQNPASATTACVIQPYNQGTSPESPDHAGNLLASAVTVPAFDLVPVPPEAVAILDLPGRGGRGSPPDLNLLYSIFRI